MKRIYHHYEKLEEVKAGMWRMVNGQARLDFRDQAAELMRDPERFKASMLKAVSDWPFSCEHNLSAKNVNRQAWMGHAGCCIAVESPEECTRLGWHMLTRKEQDEANRVADEVIAEWEQAYTAKTKGKKHA